MKVIWESNLSVCKNGLKININKKNKYKEGCVFTFTWDIWNDKKQMFPMS